MKITEKQLINIIKNKLIQECKNNTFINIIKNSINESIENSTNDTHFAILKPINKIIFSWDYNGYDPVDLRLHRQDYFSQDLIDNGFNPKEIKVLSKKACIGAGLNPDDKTCWDNGFDYMSENIKHKIKEGFGEEWNYGNDNEWDDNYSSNSFMNKDPRFNYNEFGEEGIDDETGNESIPVTIGSENAPVQHLHTNKWGDYNPEFNNLLRGKEEDNEDSWEDLDYLNNQNKEKLGTNAQDVFDGNINVDYDYFQDSDYPFTNDYWSDGEPEDEMSLSGIQRDKVNDVYDEIGENKLREMIKSKIRKSINEQTYNKMYELVRKNIVECLKSKNGKNFITEALKKSN